MGLLRTYALHQGLPNQWPLVRRLSLEGHVGLASHTCINRVCGAYIRRDESPAGLPRRYGDRSNSH